MTVSDEPLAALAAHAGQRGASIFERVVVGVDGSRASLVAARQAALLVDPAGVLATVTAIRFGDALGSRPAAREARAGLEHAGFAAVRLAAELLGPRAEYRLADGAPAEAILRELGRRHATLAAVGADGHGRVSEHLFDGVLGALLRDAPCSLLVARPALAAARFPRAIVAGTDGSRDATIAVEVARYLATRFNVPLTVVCALHGGHPDLGAARLGDAVLALDAHPVPVLVDASATADLLVVGRRGGHTLGSVSARVVHRAACSVLVVR